MRHALCVSMLVVAAVSFSNSTVAQQRQGTARAAQSERMPSPEQSRRARAQADAAFSRAVQSPEFGRANMADDRQAAGRILQAAGFGPGPVPEAEVVCLPPRIGVWVWYMGQVNYQGPLVPIRTFMCGLPKGVRWNPTD